MKRLLPALGIIIALSIACGQSGLVPATPIGGGPMPTATSPALVGGGGSGGPPSEEQGRALLISKGCIACHIIPNVQGAVGTVGPSLEGVGDPSKRPTLAAGAIANNEDN